MPESGNLIRKPFGKIPSEIQEVRNSVWQVNWDNFRDNFRIWRSHEIVGSMSLIVVKLGLGFGRSLRKTRERGKKANSGERKERTLKKVATTHSTGTEDRRQKNTG
jgi:hypothetical protein